MRKELIDLVFKIAKEKNAFEQLENYVATISKEKLAKNIIDIGILPEIFDQNSSEEKIWAKLSDSTKKTDNGNLNLFYKS